MVKRLPTYSRVITEIGTHPLFIVQYDCSLLQPSDKSVYTMLYITYIIIGLRLIGSLN